MFQFRGTWLFRHCLCWRHLILFYVEVYLRLLKRTSYHCKRALSWVDYNRAFQSRWFKFLAIPGVPLETCLAIQYSDEKIEQVTSIFKYTLPSRWRTHEESVLRTFVLRQVKTTLRDIIGLSERTELKYMFYTFKLESFKLCKMLQASANRPNIIDDTGFF